MLRSQCNWFAHVPHSLPLVLWADDDDVDDDGYHQADNEADWPPLVLQLDIHDLVLEDVVSPLVRVACVEEDDRTLLASTNETSPVFFCESQSHCMLLHFLLNQRGWRKSPRTEEISRESRWNTVLRLCRTLRRSASVHVHQNLEFRLLLSKFRNW